MENITITSTKILPIENGIGGCVAIAQMTLNDAFKLTGIKLRKTETYVKYSQKYTKNMVTIKNTQTISSLKV